MLVRSVEESVEAAFSQVCDASGLGTPGGSWHAVYFFTAIAEESLLCLELIPLMLEELAAGRISAFFFIRYDEGGRHIRLRFRSDEPDVLERVRARGANMAGGDAPIRICDGQYEPEIKRYGGPACIGICEAHFMLSSLNAWSHLQPSLELSAADLQRRVRLPRAAHDMMMVAGHAYDRPAPAIQFLREYWNSWLLPLNMRADERAEELRGVLEREMDRQFRRIGRDLRHHLLEAWRRQNDRRGGRVSAVRGAAYLPEARWSAATAYVLKALRRAGLVLDSRQGKRTVSGLIHMNNNRFGILNRDEAFLAYVCERTLAETYT